MQDGDVVISHHLPHFNSISPQYSRYRTNCFFLCDVGLDKMKKKPQLWIHGHTHTACDYKVGNTRVICNPVGYPREGCVYNPSLVIKC